MLAQRFTTTALLLVLLVATQTSSAVANTIEKPQNLTIGYRAWGDHLIQRIHVQKDYTWFRVIKETKTFTGDGVSKITEIQALDQVKDGNGAQVALINGGPGQTYVTLKFKSKRSYPINFIVEIYGKR